VLRGLAAARTAGLNPIKLNMVVMRGRNDDEILDFARLARREGYEVRFIEFMPLDADGIWSMDSVVASREIIEAIDREFALQPVMDQMPSASSGIDRKSTRLNSSHVASSYAVFCLKKKT